MQLARFQDWKSVVVPLSAALLALLAAGLAISASHYADTAVFVAAGSVMSYLGFDHIHERTTSAK